MSNFIDLPNKYQKNEILNFRIFLIFKSLISGIRNKFLVIIPSEVDHHVLGAFGQLADADARRARKSRK